MWVFGVSSFFWDHWFGASIDNIIHYPIIHHPSSIHPSKNHHHHHHHHHHQVLVGPPSKDIIFVFLVGCKTSASATFLFMQASRLVRYAKKIESVSLSVFFCHRQIRRPWKGCRICQLFKGWHVFFVFLFCTFCWTFNKKRTTFVLFQCKVFTDAKLHIIHIYR